MKSKIKTKSNSHIKNNNIKDKSKLIKKEKDNEKEINHLKKNNRTLQKNSKSKMKNKNIISKKEYKSNTKNNSKNLINKKIINNFNIEDSSTNCLSGNKKNTITKIDINILNSKTKEKTKEKFIYPFLLQKESDTESHFINFQLGEKDSYTDSTLRSNLKNNYNDKFMNINNIKLNINNDNKNGKNYDYCDVDKNIGKNENDSMEIYDFSDKTNVDYVLKNFSALSCSKSGKEKSKSSFILEDFNDEDISGNKNINKIKIFNTKQSICDNCTQIKLNKNKNINDVFIKNNSFFKPSYKY